MKFVYPFLMVFLATASFAQKSQKSTKPDSLITPTDTLVFLKDTVKLTKLELLVKQATEKQTQPAEAIALYKKALAAKTKAQDSNWVAEIRLSMSKMYFKANNSKDGFLNLLAAQSLYNQSKNASCQAYIMQDIAAIYEGSNDWKEAEKYYLLALKLQESVGLTVERPYTLLALANGYYKRKEYLQAEKYYSDALNQFELNHEKNKRADALVQLADIKIKQKNYAQAEHLILKRAMPFFSSVGKPQARIACFNMLGDIYYIQNRQSEAKWFYIQAQTMYKNQNDFDGNVRSIVNLAKVKSALGDKKSALKDFQDAEAMAIKRKKLALAADVKVAYAKYYNKPFAKVMAAQTKAEAITSVKDSAAVKPGVKKLTGITTVKGGKSVTKVDSVLKKSVKTTAVKTEKLVSKITSSSTVRRDSSAVNKPVLQNHAKAASTKSSATYLGKADSAKTKASVAGKQDVKSSVPTPKSAKVVVSGKPELKKDTGAIKIVKASVVSKPSEKVAVKTSKPAAKPDTSVKTLAKKDDKQHLRRDVTREKEDKVVVAEN
ncbi:tetratricopeptide repeat protein [Desertivirga brevis]|uniref:tetratricopeptide repeat protein n=1 Tax=Desertivirga brevis TaxID=2810310 RepID=UPI001A95A4DA|nr:tetratricopeptide repeat protein [Pedobacter sp. SYSU D00873]